MDLTELKRLHDKAYTANQITRERASEDMVFYWITHWDDAILDETQLAYRGEFDILRKAGRGIMADLAANPIQVDFEPKKESDESAGEVLDGLYRKDLKNNTSIEAFSNADQENVVCGFGAWQLYTDYETTRSGDNNQVIRRKPINEANNCVYFDPNAKLLDKSDSRYCSVLRPYTEDGYLDLVEDLTGERPESVDAESFKEPEQSYTFPWISGDSKKIYVTEFYRRKKVKKKILFLVSDFGEDKVLEEDKLDDVLDDLLDEGYTIQSEKEVDRWEVTKYIASGSEILNGEMGDDGERMGEVIAGEYIPIIPEYGEHAFIEGEEHWEGVTKLAKDPQRLRDFQMSYLSDIASRSPREKPIFTQEQIAGFEDMYDISGSDNNYPYLLQNSRDAQGTPLPVGPVGMLQAPQVPQALAATIELSRQAVEDVANPGIPQDIADPDLSGKAVLALQARLDMQSMIYQTNRKHALRHDGVVYASMASVVYDVPREVKITLPDGTEKTDKIMEDVVDQQTGEIVVLKDLRNAEFDVYSKISASYSSQKDQTLDRLDELMEKVVPGDPMRNILLLKSLKLMDGVDFDDVRDYANQQLMIMGIRKPETPEEIQFMQDQAQKGQEPSPEMIMAQAEMLRGQAEMATAQQKQVETELKAQNEAMKRQIETFKAQTDRMDTQIDAQEAGATIQNKQADTLSKNIDTQAKVIQMRRPEEMSDSEIFEELLSSG